LLALAFFFFFRKGAFLRAQIVSYYSFFFAIDDRVDAASYGSQSVDFATAFFSVIEYACSSVVSQLGRSFLAEVNEASCGVA
jgi:Na+-driven multidrug efflux pump